jgi:LacI family transcriptional regulator
MDNKFRIIKLDKSLAFPIANQLAEQLTWMIAGGIIEEGETLPPIREFADLLGINMHTVRSAYHILEKLTLVTIKPKIGTVVQKYIPFVTVPKKDLLKNELIAVFIPDLSDFYNQLLKGIEFSARKNDLIPVVISCNEDPIYAERIYRNISARNFSGAINISIGFNDAFYEEFQDEKFSHIPLVFVDVNAATSHRIIIDTEAAIYDATNHLIQHGYKDIALVNCLEDWPMGREILRGFKRALSESEIQPKQDMIFSVPSFTFEAGVFCGERILQKLQLPQAIVSASDTLALGAISAFYKNDLKIPDDIAIVGYNDIPLAKTSTPPLTTVSLPAFEMGEFAMNTLSDVIKGVTTSWVEKTFYGNLVIRDSCGCISTI